MTTHVTRSGTDRRRRRRRVLASVLALGAITLAGCDWVQAGYGAGHAFLNSSESTLTASNVGTLHQTFAADLDERTLIDPIVSGGLVVELTTPVPGATQRTVRAVSASDGSARWSTVLPSATTLTSDVVADNGLLFIATARDDGSAQLLALDPADGSTRRTTPIASLPPGAELTTVSPTLTVVGGRVVVVTEAIPSDPNAPSAITVTAVLTTSGAISWSHEIDHKYISGGGTVAVGTNVVFTFRQGAVVNDAYPSFVMDAYGSSDGGLVWSRDSSLGAFAIQPDLATNGLLVGEQFTGNGVRPVAAIDGTTGNKAWRATGNEADQGAVPFAATDQLGITAYWFSGPHLEAVNLADDTRAWMDDLPATSSTRGATIAGSVLYVQTLEANGDLVLRTYVLATGVPLATVKVASSVDSSDAVSNPIVANGEVDVTVNHTLYALAP